MRRKTCIIVDDHDVVRSGIRLHLKLVEWLEIVGEANTGPKALDLIRDLKPDLALLDLRLPELDGREVTAAVVAEKLSTHTVIFSGFGTTALAEQALDAGAYGYVLKSVSIAMVVEALRCAAEGQRFIDPSLAAELLFPGSPPLSPRELEILKIMSRGTQNSGIAFALGISIDTVKAHVSNILTKLGVDSRTEAVATALRRSIIE
ncbi:MAG: response regulator transcription factor [Thermoleophilia bacterium]|nr:response regulator transcription factor [Thermoleophilia bacterium]